VNEKSGTRIREVDIEAGATGMGVIVVRSGATGGRVVEVEGIDISPQMDPLRQLRYPLGLFRSDEIWKFEARNGTHESKDEQGLKKKMSTKCSILADVGCCRADD
jgi:hypothetical protein